MVTKDSTTNILIDRAVVRKAIEQLNTNKVPNIFGLQAEHFRYRGKLALEILSTIITAIVQTGSIPYVLKQGIL